MIENQIEKLEQACLVIARAIEDGKIEGVLDEVKDLLGYNMIP